MYCVKCGRQLLDAANFCSYCGTKAYRPEIDESPAQPLELLESPARQTIPPAAPVTEAPRESSMSLTALVCGILAICLFWSVVPGIVLGLVALVFGVRSTVKYPEIQKAQAVAGFILGITAIALSALVIAQLWGTPNIFLSLSQTNLSRL